MSQAHLTTADELWTMPRNDCRRELVRGELRTSSFRGGEHGFVAMKVAGPLHQFVTVHRLGIVVAAGTGFHLASDPDTVRAPDGAFIRQARIARRGIPEWF